MHIMDDLAPGGSGGEEALRAIGWAKPLASSKAAGVHKYRIIQSKAERSALLFEGLRLD